MKRVTYFIFAFAAALTLNSCEAVKEKLTVNVDFEVPEIAFTVPGENSEIKDIQTLPDMQRTNFSGNEQIVFDKTIDVDINAESLKQNFKLDILKSLKLLEGAMLFKEGPDGTIVNLDEYKSLKLYVDGPDRLVARVKLVDKEKGEVIMEVLDLEVKDLLSKDQLRLILTVAKDQLPAYEADFGLKLKFRARVGLK